jgi:RNA-directed DNA polymerase
VLFTALSPLVRLAERATFCGEVTKHWYRALRRRSQRTSLTWERMSRLEARWLPPAKIMQPWLNVRFDAITQGRSPVR